MSVDPAEAGSVSPSAPTACPFPFPLPALADPPPGRQHSAFLWPLRPQLWQTTSLAAPEPEAAAAAPGSLSTKHWCPLDRRRPVRRPPLRVL
eukprot:5865140-Amphidinium_carterae.1